LVIEHNANLFGSKRLETSRHSVAIGGAAAAAAEPSPITDDTSGARPDDAFSPSPAVMPSPAMPVGSMPIPDIVFIPMFVPTPTAGVIGPPRDMPEQQCD